jgi:tripeptidyl-peptidase I
MLTSALLAAVIAAQTAFASPIRARTPYAVKEKHYAPREWTKLERSSGNNLVQLQIGLKQGKFDDLVKHLNEGEFGGAGRLYCING